MSLKERALDAAAPLQREQREQRERWKEEGWQRAERALRKTLSTIKSYPKQEEPWVGEIQRLNIVRDAITHVTFGHSRRILGTDTVYRLRAEEMEFGCFHDRKVSPTEHGVHLERACAQCGERGWTEGIADLTELGMELSKKKFVCPACELQIPSNCPTCGRRN